MFKGKCLITGTSGFIAPHLANKLADMGYKVYGLERYVTGRTNYACDIKFNRVFGNLCDHAHIRQIVRNIRPDYVFHLAAMSPVAYSYDRYIEVNETNYIATINLAEACMRHDENLKQFLFAGCYDEETEMLTRDGWKQWDELQTSDLALSINPETKKIEWKPITKIVKKQYVGKMVHFTGRSVDILVTPNHNMLIETKGNTRNKIIFEDAIKTKNRSKCWLVKGQWTSERITPNTINDINIEDFFYLTGFYLAEGNSDLQLTNYVPKTKMTHDQFVSKCRTNNGQFIQTQKSNNKTKQSQSARIFFNNQRTDLKLKVHEKLVKNSIPSKIEKNCVFSSSKKLFHLFDNLGHSALTKNIPRWMLDADRKCLIQLFDGLMDGDGTKRGRSFSTSSKQLMTNFVELCIKLGFGTTIGVRCNRKNKLNNRTISSNNPQYTVYINKSKKALYNHNNELVDYSGMIWCPVVEDNHTLFIKRNGKTAWCGNTSEEYGNQISVPIKENVKLYPNSPYACSKVAANEYLNYMYEAYGFPATICRPFNTYGRVGTTHFVVERILSQMLDGQPKILLGDPEPVRDLMFRDDHVNGYLAAFEGRENMEGGAYGETFNFCTGVGYSIKELVEICVNLTSYKGEIVWNTIPARPLDIDVLIGDNSKAKSILGWSPQYDLETGLTQTIDELMSWEASEHIVVH